MGNQKTVQFFLHLIPPTITHQEKKVAVVKGKPVFYEPAELKAARQKLSDYLARYRPETPLEGALRMETGWWFPVSDRHADGSWRAVKPDTDNLQKLLKDCMTDLGFWHDDAQVCWEQVEKKHSVLPGIKIRITELKQP